MKHDLKILPQYFCRVADGSKTFEVRENDRGFQPGDVVILREHDPKTDLASQYSGKFIECRVGYVLPIDGGQVIFSIFPVNPE